MPLRYRHAAVSLALAAMMLRALLPMGWMPNPAGFAQSPLVICLMDTPAGPDVAQAMNMPGMDMSQMDMPQMDMPGQGHDHGQRQNSEQPCPFAAAPHVAASGGAVIGPAPSSLLARLADRLSSETAVALAPVYQPQSPRAPPSFA